MTTQTTKDCRLHSKCDSDKKKEKLSFFSVMSALEDPAFLQCMMNHLTLGCVGRLGRVSRTMRTCVSQCRSADWPPILLLVDDGSGHASSRAYSRRCIECASSSFLLARCYNQCSATAFSLCVRCHSDPLGYRRRWNAQLVRRHVGSRRRTELTIRRLPPPMMTLEGPMLSCWWKHDVMRVQSELAFSDS